MTFLEKQARTNVGKKLMKLIEANPNKHWNWQAISRNPNLIMEIIEANPDKPWNWQAISRNPNITMEIIEANPNKPWDWDYISRNPNLTMEFIEANPDKPWDWDYISSNKFQGEYKKELQRLKKINQLIHNRYVYRKKIGLGM